MSPLPRPSLAVYRGPVVGDMGLSCEGLVTDRAGMRFLALVCLHVNLQVCFGAGGMIAQVTLVRPDSQMYAANMLLNMLQGGGSVITLVTGQDTIFSVILVNWTVTIQLLLVPKLLIALITRKLKVLMFLVNMFLYRIYYSFYIRILISALNVRPFLIPTLIIIFSIHVLLLFLHILGIC